MTTWIIEPHDPLIVRDGKPFDTTPGARAISLFFPFPSTTTGGARTRIGIDKDGSFDLSQIAYLKTISVRGPLLVQIKDNGDDTGIEDWFAPAPADALLFEVKEQAEHVTIRVLVPLQPFSGTQTDFDSTTSNPQSLHLVGLSTIRQDDKRKPAKEQPRYWTWDTFQKWLVDPHSFENEPKPTSKLGLSGPQRDQRFHVSIDPETGAALDGALFATAGLEFTAIEKKHLAQARRLALAVAVNETKEENNTLLAPIASKEGTASFGGERRIVQWRKSNSSLPPCSDEIKAEIVQQKACRVILLTPAYFEQGYLPQWLTKPQTDIDVTPKLKAVAIQHPQVASGWDLELKSPKPTRRLAPAGSVFYLTLEGITEDAIQTWINEIWMHCISDQLQDRKDGFGLAVVGTWSGVPETMEMESQS